MEKLRKKEINTLIFDKNHPILLLREYTRQTESATEYKISSRLPQDSAMDHNLWNTYSDWVLELRIPERVNVGGFADGLPQKWIELTEIGRI